jgi:threonine synthase
MVANDFSSINNYFIRNGIENLKEDVMVKFYIDKENKMHIVEVEGNDEDARTYIKQLLDGKKVIASDMVVNKYYLLGIRIDYRS